MASLMDARDMLIDDSPKNMASPVKCAAFGLPVRIYTAIEAAIADAKAKRLITIGISNLGLLLTNSIIPHILYCASSPRPS